MKKIILLVAVLFMAVASQAQTLQSLFEKYSENENFEYVSVGGNGMTVASANGNVAKSKNAGPKKKSTKILTLKAGADSQIMKAFEKELNAVLETGKFETTLETRSKGESTHIYYRSLGNDNADQLIVAKSKNTNPKKKTTKILTLKAGADSQIMKAFETDLNAVLEAGKFETTLETRSKGESTHIYYRSLGNDNADQLIVAKTKTELSLIWESGKLGKGQMKYGISSTDDVDDLEDMDLGMH